MEYLNDKHVNVLDFGAKGDGLADDAPAIQSALDSGEMRIIVPNGKYVLGAPLRIGSDTELYCDENAVLKLMDNVCKTRHDGILTNKDPVGGNKNIVVSGGIWDGNNPGNRRSDGIFDEGFTGSAFRFLNVKRLILEKLTMIDSEAYYLMLGEVEGFRVSDIDFKADNLRPNQDGVHLGGFCYDGVIRNIRAHGSATNDDLVALNADDNVERLTNHGMKRGPIKNVCIENIRSENCFTMIRLLSVEAEISNIHIDGVYGGFRNYGVNMDGARYTRTPLFEDKPGVYVGNIKDVMIRNMNVYKTADNKSPVFFCESHCEGFRVENFMRDMSKDCAPEAPTFFYAKKDGADINFTAVEPDSVISVTNGGFSGLEIL